MRRLINKLKRNYSILIAAIVLGMSILPIMFQLTPYTESEVNSWNGQPITELKDYSGYLSNNSNNIFYFVQITDVHINAFNLIYENQVNVFQRALEEITNYIKPTLIIDSGDLVNGLNPLPYYQDESQWIARATILNDTNMNASYYYDIVGNHGGYGDSINFTYYKKYSIQYPVQKEMQYTFNRTFSFGNYTFIALNSAWNDGSKWPDGTNGDLDRSELDWFESKLKNSTNFNLTFVITHHPYTDVGKNTTTTGLTYLQLLEKYNVTVHLFGHGHDNMERNEGGTTCVETNSLGMGDQGYRIFAVDNDGISMKPEYLSHWPNAMITTPMDRNLTRTAYDIPNTTKVVPVRALVFDKVSVDTVHFNIDGGPWKNMVNNTLSNPLYNGSFDATTLSDGIHNINLEVISSSGVSTDVITIYIGDNNKPEIINGKLENVVRYSDADPLKYNLTMFKWDKFDSNNQLKWNVSGIDENFCNISIIGTLNNTLLIDPVPGATGTKTITITLINSAGKSTSQQINITLYIRIATNQLMWIISIIEILILIVSIIIGIFWPKIEKLRIFNKK